MEATDRFGSGRNGRPDSSRTPRGRICRWFPAVVLHFVSTKFRRVIPMQGQRPHQPISSPTAAKESQPCARSLTETYRFYRAFTRQVSPQ